MARYALLIEYDGSPFCGWQVQSNAPSVQQTLEAALAKLEPAAERLTCAGRTDTGVHATGQVAHVDLHKDWTTDKLTGALNHHLKPHPIAILAAALVDDTFSARFSAISRRYLFRVQSRRAPLVVDKGRVWRVAHALDLDAMQDAANHLLGKHDFTTFRSVHCQAQSPVKSIDKVTITKFPVVGGTEYQFTLEARSFMHNQVRSIVGTLERVGSGSKTPEDFKSALDACDRAQCGPVAPPHGLYFEAVSYEQDPFAQSR